MVTAEAVNACAEKWAHVRQSVGSLELAACAGSWPTLERNHETDNGISATITKPQSSI
jgi:hypothetical protein